MNKDMVWKSGKSESEISDMSPGDVVMGDVGILRWSVLRGFQHEDEDLVPFVQEKLQMVDSIGKKQHGWWDVQKGGKGMQFPELVSANPKEEPLFKKWKGSRF